MTPSILVPATISSDARQLKSADGTSVYAEAVGDPSKPHLVFLHGFSLSTVVFDSIFYSTHYAEQFYLVRYDMRGHGRSGKPNDSQSYASKRFAEDFAAVAKAYNLKRPIFAGWSLGATVIVDIVTHLPANTISGAVYLGALPYTGMTPRVMLAPVLETIRKFHRNEDVTDFVSAKIPFVESCFAAPDHIPHEVKCLWAGATLASTPVQLKLAFTRSQDPTALLKVARGGSLPLLVLHGELDVIILCKNLVREVEAMGWRDAQVVILEGIGHSPFYESMDRVMMHVGELAKRVRAGQHAPKL